jgi:uncharacterized NAD-dependent epimerase/dehydratase family protein
MPESALLLAHGHYRTDFAKTSHGLVRGPSRWPVAGVIDPDWAGGDAGELLDGRRRGIPIFADLPAALAALPAPPTHCVVGVATEGGYLPPRLRPDLLAAAGAGMVLVNGLHQLLADDPEIAAAAGGDPARIIDVRRPRPVRELRFWTGECLRLPGIRIAVLGTDCAIGKRTTCVGLRDALRRQGVAAEMVFTGQTGWLQGFRHGFILDATPNDFVCGELERAILECHRHAAPEVILLEGQSSLRNPSGPCGAELILAGGARLVVLQHDPARAFFEGLEEAGCAIPSLAGEIELIQLLGAEVVAVTLNEGRLAAGEAEGTRRALEEELGIPVVLPLSGGPAALDRVAGELLAARGGSG